MKSLLNKEIEFKLTVAESIVLASLVERLDEIKDEIFSDYEKRALWNLECMLEKELTEPLIDDYAATLNEAKKHLTGKEK